MIKTTTVNHDALRASNTVTETFRGRVLKVNTFTARRNMSDTLDYTDFCDVKCVEAIVWLGTFGVPPTFQGDRFPRYYVPFNGEGARELEYFEQFAIVDCSNHFVWRGSPIMEATVDAEMADETTDGMMWVNWAAVQAFHSANAEAAKIKQAARDAEEAARVSQIAQKAATKAAGLALFKLGMEVKCLRGKTAGLHGKIAFIRNDTALVKDCAKWQDRAAGGTWVKLQMLTATV